LKTKASEKFKATIEQLVLIYSGKILRDTDTLDQHHIKDGHTVHLVIKSAPKATQPNTTSTSSTPTTAPPSTQTGNTSTSSAPPFGMSEYLVNLLVFFGRLLCSTTLIFL